MKRGNLWYFYPLPWPGVADVELESPDGFEKDHEGRDVPKLLVV